MSPFVTGNTPTLPTALAPDGSEIRELAQLPGVSMVHCALPVGAVTLPVTHRTVEEIWWVISGEGKLWRRELSSGEEEISPLRPGVFATIALGTAFQFRNSGDERLELLLVTSPPWPGPDEARPTDGCWEPRLPPNETMGAV